MYEWNDNKIKEDLITMITADGQMHMNGDHISILDDDCRKIYGDSCIQLRNFRCRAGIDKVDENMRRLSLKMIRIRYTANNPFELMGQTDQTKVAENEEEQYCFTQNKTSIQPHHS